MQVEDRRKKGNKKEGRREEDFWGYGRRGIESEVN
jgi:hypothetical protein